MNRGLPLFASCLCAALGFLVSGCDSSSISAGTGGLSPSASHTIVASAQSIMFSSASAQSLTLSEAGYNGSFTVTSSDTSVVTVTGSQNTFEVSPVGGGAATLKVNDTIGDSISIPVNVTGLTLEPQGISKEHT